MLDMPSDEVKRNKKISYRTSKQFPSSRTNAVIGKPLPGRNELEHGADIDIGDGRRFRIEALTVARKLVSSHLRSDSYRGSISTLDFRSSGPILTGASFT